MPTVQPDAHGDENNQDAHGQVPGYAVTNLDGAWRFAKNWELFARVDNVFNRDYANFGILGSNVFPNPARTFDPANQVAEPFLGRRSTARRMDRVAIRVEVKAESQGSTGKSLSRQRLAGRAHG